MRTLDTLRLPSEEIFARVLEGICPGCDRPLEIRQLQVGEVTKYADRCGWCTLCEWGWSAFIWRESQGNGTEPWKPGEHLITVYAEGAILTSNVLDDGPATSRIIEP